MTGDTAASHRAALDTLRRVARLTAAGPPAAELTGLLDGCVDAAVAEASTPVPPGTVRDLARAYLLGARVGGDAADPVRAARWLEGWSRARSRTPEQAHLAVVDAIRFGERLHRALGIPDAE